MKKNERKGIGEGSGVSFSAFFVCRPYLTFFSFSLCYNGKKDTTDKRKAQAGDVYAGIRVRKDP